MQRKVKNSLLHYNNYHYPGCQRLFYFSRLRRSWLRPSANTENFRRTREKPLVPRVADTHGKRKWFPLLHGAGRHYNGSQKWPLE